MRAIWSSRHTVLGILAALALVGLIATGGGPARAGDPEKTPGPVILAFGVGGILASDGTLWQYRPDLDRWLTIDEAFREEGRESTRVLPLPVPVEEIRDMASFGFIVTHSGDLWLYEMSTDRWRKLKSPIQ